jgi:alpha/beta superfamily hydrolase
MRHPLLAAITSAATRAGFDVLRFDFRGVGDSTGIHGDGVAELNDVAAAVVAMEDLGSPVIGITGWSFGAATALGWHTEAASTVAYVGIAPPVDSPLSPQLPVAALVTEPADRTFIVGARDQFVDIDALARYATAIDASVVRYETADHFFIGRYDRVADDVIAAIAP